MLSAQNRLRSKELYQRAFRRGRRSSRRTLAVFLVEVPDGHGAPRCGLVVSRAVGNSVTRHLVSRRLRHLCRESLQLLSKESVMVVRAHAPAAQCTFDELRTDFQDALTACLRTTNSPTAGSSRS